MYMYPAGSPAVTPNGTNGTYWGYGTPTHQIYYNPYQQYDNQDGLVDGDLGEDNNNKQHDKGSKDDKSDKVDGETENGADNVSESVSVHDNDSELLGNETENGNDLEIHIGNGSDVRLHSPQVKDSPNKSTKA